MTPGQPLCFVHGAFKVRQVGCCEKESLALCCTLIVRDLLMPQTEYSAEEVASVPLHQPQELGALLDAMG